MAGVFANDFSPSGTYTWYTQLVLGDFMFVGIRPSAMTASEGMTWLPTSNISSAGMDAVCQGNLIIGIVLCR